MARARLSKTSRHAANAPFVAARHDHHVAAAGLLAGAGDRGVEVGDAPARQSRAPIAAVAAGPPVVVSTIV